MLNLAAIVGRITRDPELRTTQTGKNVCSFTVAVSKKVKPTDGSPDAYFLNCVSWGAQADYVSNYLTKGRLVSVQGSLQSRRYTTNDGQQREVVEIDVDRVSALDRPRETTEEATPEEPEHDPFKDA